MGQKMRILVCPLFCLFLSNKYCTRPLKFLKEALSKNKCKFSEYAKDCLVISCCLGVVHILKTVIQRTVSTLSTQALLKQGFSLKP